MDLASWEKRMKILIGTQDWNHGKCICKENLRKISRESQSWTDVRRWSLYFPKGLKHRHRRNVTSHHFTSFLFTSFHFYVYSNFFGSNQLKGKYNTQLHIHISNNSTFTLISLHFSLSLLLSIERQK